MIVRLDDVSCGKIIQSELDYLLGAAVQCRFNANAEKNQFNKDAWSAAAQWFETGASAYSSASERIRVLEEEQQWRPIETAPKNGTRIIVYRPQGDKPEGYIPKVGEDYWGRFLAGSAWAKSNKDKQPTLWKPLPDPPCRAALHAELDRSGE